MDVTVDKNNILAYDTRRLYGGDGGVGDYFRAYEVVRRGLDSCTRSLVHIQ